MDNLAITLCEQIKLATFDDSKNRELKNNALVALAEIIKLNPNLNEFNELKIKYERLIQQLFYYLVYQELKRCEDIDFSQAINDILQIQSEFVDILIKEREKINKKGQQTNLNYQLSINKIFREFNASDLLIIPSEILIDNIELIIQDIDSLNLTHLKLDLQKKIQVLVKYLSNQKKTENAAEAISQMIDQISQIKNYLDEGFKKYYEVALPKTEKNVKKDIYKFIQIYKIDLSKINCQNNDDKNKIKKYFVKWVSMILKRRCIDAHRTQKTRNKNNQPGVINNSLNKKQYGENSTQETIDTIVDPKITNSRQSELRKIELRNIKSIITRYIEDDPDSKLKDCHPRNRPDCNCQILLKRRLIDDECNVSEIAKELNMSRATLQDFLEYRPSSKRSDAKCLRLLIKEIEKREQINLSNYINI